MNKDEGFTLVELLFIFIVISILLSFGYSQFNDYVLKSKQKEAYLKTIDNIVKNIDVYANVLQVASNTGNNQFDSTLTLMQYNQIISNDFNLNPNLTIQTEISSSQTIKLYFQASGIAKVIDGSKTVAYKRFIKQKSWYEY